MSSFSSSSSSGAGHVLINERTWLRSEDSLTASLTSLPSTSIENVCWSQSRIRHNAVLTPHHICVLLLLGWWSVFQDMVSLRDCSDNTCLVYHRSVAVYSPWVLILTDAWKGLWSKRSRISSTCVQCYLVFEYLNDSRGFVANESILETRWVDMFHSRFALEHHVHIPTASPYRSKTDRASTWTPIDEHLDRILLHHERLRCYPTQQASSLLLSLEFLLLFLFVLPSSSGIFSPGKRLRIVP